MTRPESGYEVASCLYFFFASCVIQLFAIDFYVKECEREAQETPLLRQNEYLMNRVSTSVSSTKPENWDFDVLFLSTTVKRGPAVCIFTCSYCVFIIKLIVFCGST